VATRKALIGLMRTGLQSRLYMTLPLMRRPRPDACAVTRLPVNPASHIAHGWDICQPVMADGSAKDVNRLILDELQDGVGTIWLQGLQTADLAGQLPAMMQDVVFAAAGIHLDAWQ
jgi:hypothetical protein